MRFSLIATRWSSTYTGTLYMKYLTVLIHRYWNIIDWSVDTSCLNVCSSGTDYRLSAWHEVHISMALVINISYNFFYVHDQVVQNANGRLWAGSWNFVMCGIKSVTMNTTTKRTKPPQVVIQTYKVSWCSFVSSHQLFFMVCFSFFLVCLSLNVQFLAERTEMAHEKVVKLSTLSIKFPLCLIRML